MTMDRELHRDRLDDELARALGAYADARLSPDRRASTRMRVSVIEAGHESLARRAAAAVPQRDRWLQRMRVGGFVSLVAVLSISLGATTALAATPGGPLYGVRLWLENQTLPAGGQARTDAQVAQIDERVDEATVSADESNDNGVAAALSAYSDELDGALADAGQDPTKLAHLQAEISKHIAVLEGLLTGNPTAAAAIQRAIDRSNAMLVRIAQRLAGPGGGNGNNGGNGGNGGNQGGPPGNGGGSGSGNGNGGPPSPRPGGQGGSSTHP